MCIAFFALTDLLLIILPVIQLACYYHYTFLWFIWYKSLSHSVLFRSGFNCSRYITWGDVTQLRRRSSPAKAVVVTTTRFLIYRPWSEYTLQTDYILVLDFNCRPGRLLFFPRSKDIFNGIKCVILASCLSIFEIQGQSYFVYIPGIWLYIYLCYCISTPLPFYHGLRHKRPRWFASAQI